MGRLTASAAVCWLLQRGRREWPFGGATVPKKRSCELSLGRGNVRHGSRKGAFGRAAVVRSISCELILFSFRRLIFLTAALALFKISALL